MPLRNRSIRVSRYDPLHAVRLALDHPLRVARAIASDLGARRDEVVAHLGRLRIARRASVVDRPATTGGPGSTGASTKYLHPAAQAVHALTHPSAKIDEGVVTIPSLAAHELLRGNAAELLATLAADDEER